MFIYDLINFFGGLFGAGDVPASASSNAAVAVGQRWFFRGPESSGSISSDIAAGIDAVSANTVSCDTASSNAATISEAAAESVAEITENLSAFQQFMQTLPTRATAFAIKATFALIILVGGCYLIKIIRIILRKSLEKARVDLSIRHFIDSLVKVVLFALLLIYIASYFGVETTSLVALLGSAGVTIALAIQGSLSNITGGVLILLLKPFKLGDYIHEDNNGNEGVVKEIGLFYTKLHTLDGRTVVLPNGPLANTSLINVNMAPMRQLILTVGIAYDADIDKARTVILEVLGGCNLILNDLPKKVYVESLDSSAVTLGVRAFVKNEDYFEAKWYFTEHVKKSFDKNGVAIPFDQLDVHIKDADNS